MKYELETIPVWDALEKDGECLMCHLMKQSHDDAINYFLGSSVMNSETRVKVNATGFCPEHWNDLVQRRSPQPLALISHTYLQETMKKLSTLQKKIERSRAGKKVEKEVDSLLEYLQEREKGCLVCEKMESRMKRYAYTVVKLYQDNGEFRSAFLQSKGLCLYHCESLLDMGKEVLNKATFLEFSKDLVTLINSNLERLEKEVWWMTQKYKSENGDKPWNGCEDAHQRVVKKIVGDGRIFSLKR
jgi:hypothetical protein